MRSPLALAALATVAVPGLDAYDVRLPATPAGELDVAVVIDSTSRRWVVRAPQSTVSGASLDAEVEHLRVLVSFCDKELLPFAVPRIAGSAHLPEGGRAVVHPELPGRTIDLADLTPGGDLAVSLGRAVAAIHELPPSAVEGLDRPVYTAESYRERRLAEVDEAAKTGKVPAGLLRRWEAQLENVSLWRFRPTVVHDNLSTDHVLVAGQDVTGVLAWSDLQVADPADDLAWLVVAAPLDAVDTIIDAYWAARSATADEHLVTRAMLAGELALARWLMHGVRSDDAAIVADAVHMLVELDEYVRAPAEYSGASL